MTTDHSWMDEVQHRPDAIEAAHARAARRELGHALSGTADMMRPMIGGLIGCAAAARQGGSDDCARCLLVAAVLVLDGLAALPLGAPLAAEEIRAEFILELERVPHITREDFEAAEVLVRKLREIEA